MSYLKSVTLTVLELLAFNATKATEPRGNGGARPCNAEIAGAKLSFRPRNNMSSLSVGC